MTLLITDIDSSRLSLPADCRVVEASCGRKHCVGCFGCWVKTPGECVIKDDISRNAVDMAKCERLVIISRCVYGSYSPEVKRVLDRSIGYLHPYMVKSKGEMHHKKRYDHSFELYVRFYGDITDSERQTALQLVEANSDNWYAEVKDVRFYGSADQAAEVAL